MDVLIFTCQPGQSILLPTTAPGPRSIALFAAVRAQPPAGSLPPMPTGHRGEPFLSVTTRAHKTIYDNGFPGVCAICPRTVAGAAGGAEAGVASAPPEKPYVGGTGGVRKRVHAHIVRLPPKGTRLCVRVLKSCAALLKGLSWAERGAPPSGRRFVVRQRARKGGERTLIRPF